MIEEQKSGESQDKRPSYYRSGRVVSGIYVVVVGIIFLLNNFGIFKGDAWGKLWPLFIIVPGLLMIFRPTRW